MNTKLRCLIYLISVSFFMPNSSVYAQLTSKDYAVMLQAEIDTLAGSITLKWPADNSATGYRIFKKTTNAANWGNAIATLGASATSYTDNNIAKGSTVEYYVQRGHTSRLAHGYIYVGMVAQPIAHRGHVLLLIDENYAAPLANEIETLKWDLIKDGWAFSSIIIPRGESASQVKQRIIQAYNRPNKPTTLYILGRVSVPYSGGFVAVQGQIFPPDGHADHGGAWPTDLYYATLNEDFWTDIEVNDTTPARVQNRNIPGDGKFDQMFLGDEPTQLEVGRVDLVNMPAFAQSDTQLVAQYLNKAHRFRNGLTPVVHRGLIDDHFGPMNGEAFSASAWRAFSTMFGDSVEAADYMTETKQRNYLFTYGCGAGTYTSASGVATTQQFTNDSITQIFTMLFGSYFGDWDSQNNLLRAPLASANGGLINAWSGRPHWHFHHMALGLHTGFSARLTANNFFTNDIQPSGYVHNLCPTFISINLMGDPTLRLHTRPHTTTLQATESADRMHINLSWTPTNGAYGYLITKSRNPLDGFSHPVLLPASATSHTDTVPYFGKGYYLVRPVFLEQTPSGMYLNPLPGSIDSANSINPNGLISRTNYVASFKLYPNPAKSRVWIDLNKIHHDACIQIVDMAGQLVLSKTHYANQPINIEQLPAGIYFVKLSSDKGQATQKLIIAR